MVTILMIPAKMTTPGLLKIKVIWNKGYDVINSVHDVTNKILSRDSNHIVDVVMCPRFGNASISVREVNCIRIYKPNNFINLNFIRIWPEKLLFLRVGLGSSSINCDWH